LLQAAVVAALGSAAVAALADIVRLLHNLLQLELITLAQLAAVVLVLPIVKILDQTELHLPLIQIVLLAAAVVVLILPWVLEFKLLLATEDLAAVFLEMLRAVQVAAVLETQAVIVPAKETQADLVKP
jgi:hypothetical protein